MKIYTEVTLDLSTVLTAFIKNIKSKAKKNNFKLFF